MQKRIAVFCDGDFWHGKEWQERRARLATGHNSRYWIGKIESNIDRDRRVAETLRAEGWIVLRFWESDIKTDLDSVVTAVENALRG